MGYVEHVDNENPKRSCGMKCLYSSQITTTICDMCAVVIVRMVEEVVKGFVRTFLQRRFQICR
jgi:hypothetical protein